LNADHNIDSGCSPGVVKNDHRYARPSSEKPVPPKKGQSHVSRAAMRRSQSFITTFCDQEGPSKDHDDVALTSLSEGSDVLLLDGSKSVACGKVLASRILHGREVPAAMTLVTIKEVMNKKCSLKFLLAFDNTDDLLTPGLITGWPTKLLQHM